MTTDPLNSPSLQSKALLGLVLVVTALFAENMKLPPPTGPTRYWKRVLAGRFVSV